MKGLVGVKGNQQIAKSGDLRSLTPCYKVFDPVLLTPCYSDPVLEEAVYDQADPVFSLMRSDVTDTPNASNLGSSVAANNFHKSWNSFVQNTQLIRERSFDFGRLLTKNLYNRLGIRGVQQLQE